MIFSRGDVISLAKCDGKLNIYLTFYISRILRHDIKTDNRDISTWTSRANDVFLRGSTGRSGQTGIATTNFPACRRMQAQRNGTSITVEFLFTSAIESHRAEQCKKGIENGQRNSRGKEWRLYSCRTTPAHKQEILSRPDTYTHTHMRVHKTPKINFPNAWSLTCSHTTNEPIRYHLFRVTRDRARSWLRLRSYTASRI